MKEERAAILESFLSMDDRELFLVLTGERGIVAQMYLRGAAGVGGAPARPVQTGGQALGLGVGGDADLRTMVRVICGKEPALLLELIKSAAKEAGKIMLSASEISPETDEKQGHANFVTSYDRRIQEYLFKALHELLPEAHFVGEEEGKDQFLEADRKGYAFVIDPIDGTSNFIAKYRPSVVSIGLFKDGAPYLGVVYNPYDDVLCHAVKGEGAFWNDEPMHSSRLPLSRSLVGFGTSPYYEELSEKTFRYASRYLSKSIDLRRSGTAAWDLSLVAKGVTGLFFELKLSLWDFAAGALIAQEAGCTVTDIEGNPLRWDGPSSVLCASEGAAKDDYILTF